MGGADQKEEGRRQIEVSGIRMNWDPDKGACSFEDLPVAMMWVDSTLAGLMSGVQAMVGTPRFLLALESEGRKSVEADWRVIAKCPDFAEGFKAIANIAAVAGWGRWSLVSLDAERKECVFRVEGCWEGRYQKALGVRWGSAMLAGKLAGYCSRLFETNCWADQTKFIAGGDPCDEFLVKPSSRSTEKEIQSLLASDEATRADMAAALRNLEEEIAERTQAEEKLRTSQALLHGMLDAIPDLLLIVDRDYRIVYSNFKGHDLIVLPEGVACDKCYERFMLLGAPCEDCTAKRIFETGRQVEREKVNPADGHVREVRAFPVFDSENRVVMVVEHARDITERKLAEDRLRRSEEDLRQAQSVAHVGSWRWSIQTDALELSDETYRILGIDKEIFSGLQKDAVAQVIHPDCFHNVEQDYGAVMRGEKPAPAEFRVVWPDGSVHVVWAEAGDLILDEAGRPAFLSGIVQDITERKRAESSLRESEEKFRSLAEQTSDWIWEVDENNRYTYSNPKVRDILGYEPEEVLGKSPLDFMSPVEAQRVGALFRDFASSVQPFSAIENVNVHKDGHEVVLETSGIPRFDSEGSFKGYRGIDRDVTERKRAEQALRENETMYRSVIGNIHDVFYRSDLQGRLIMGSPSGAKMFGYDSIEEMIGLPLESLWPDPKGRAQILAQVKASGSVRDYEAVLKRRDGSFFNASFTTHFYYDEHGNLRGTEGIIRDVTERKRAEAALRKSEEEFRAFVETSNDWIWAIDLEGRHTYTNTKIRDFLGIEPHECSGIRAADFLHPDDVARVEATLAECTASRKGWVGLVLRWRHKDGTYRWSESSAVPIFDDNGNLVGFRGTDRDITDRKQAETERIELERRLLDAQKLESLGILAGGIAHDFNNLLMAILGNLDLSLDEIPRGSSARLSIEQAMYASRRATDLTRQLLAYSGKGHFVVANMDLNDLVQENADLFRAAISRTVAMNLRLAPEPLLIEADPGQVQQIVMNLITNASEAIADAPGTISLSTSAMECDEAYLSESRLKERPVPGRFVYLQVSDTGCGMDGQTLEKIFDPFFTTKFTGRGLGMSAVLGIVRGHKGAIMVDSAVGKGTTIRVLFPERPARAPEKPVDSDQPAQLRAARPRSGYILVVDDEETIRRLCAKFVEILGFKPLSAEHGEQAIALFKKHTDEIACVILDLTMPRMDGLTTFRDLKRLRPDVKVILCSGYSEHDATKRFAQQGLAGFIQKPYVMNDLKKKIEEALGESC